MNRSSNKFLPPVTAGIFPGKFADNTFSTSNKAVLATTLALLILLGFTFRVSGLGVESFGEDELNKLQTVTDYRQNGLSGRNGEHPFLMKGLQTVSIVAAEKINGYFASANISEEGALRFPTAVIGSLTILVLFLLVSELFGSTIGLMSAAFWAVDPNAIGFDRIAKEDSFFLFFFLLGGFFWVRSQTRAERGESGSDKFLLTSAVAFGGMMASKYLPHLLGVSAAYYNLFQRMDVTKWRFGKLKWFGFLFAMGIAFLIFNPTIILPETWKEMLTFSGEKRIGHDAYEFAGELYRNKFTMFLNGVPWTFYFVFILTKTPLFTLISFLIGIPFSFKKQLGDGRYYLLFWGGFWFMPFSIMGGKFTRYFAVAQPLVFIFAAIGLYFLFQIFVKNRLASILGFAVVLAVSLLDSATVSPHYRLFTNLIGNGEQRFPHDEFYDLSSREAVAEIAKIAPADAQIATETTYLIDYYAAKVGRHDLRSISLSDTEAVKKLNIGDFIIVAEGRRYFSNEKYLSYLKNNANPVFEIKNNSITSVKIYRIDAEILSKMIENAKNY